MLNSSVRDPRGKGPGTFLGITVQISPNFRFFTSPVQQSLSAGSRTAILPAFYLARTAIFLASTAIFPRAGSSNLSRHYSFSTSPGPIFVFPRGSLIVISSFVEHISLWGSTFLFGGTHFFVFSPQKRIFSTKENFLHKREYCVFLCHADALARQLLTALRLLSRSLHIGSNIVATDSSTDFEVELRSRFCLSFRTV